MFPTQATIMILAERIEQAYERRNPHWCGIGVTARVWEMAAVGLYLLHRKDRSIPVDPELFVASQSREGRWADPWAELTPPRALRRYRRKIRQIVRKLRSELDSELDRAERQVIRGANVKSLVLGQIGSLSPLGCYVLAHRAGLDDLIEQIRPDAEQQHLSCPLYREACLNLLPEGLYPEPSVEDSSEDEELARGSTPAFSLN